jgi:hypothetical protein
MPLASARTPVKPVPDPEGSWPIRFDRLVQPVLDAKCYDCHHPGVENAVAAGFDLTPAKAYDTLVGYGKPSLRDFIRQRWNDGRSIAGEGPALTGALMPRITAGPEHAKLAMDADSTYRLILWMDTYAQRLGAFSAGQEEELARLKEQFLSSNPDASR